MFIFLPLIAFLNMLLYWRPRYRYAEQLLFFVHLHAFYFSIAILLLLISEAAGAWPKLGGVAAFLSTILGWTLPVYSLMAMRRVFRRSWLGTAFKAVVLFFVYSIVAGLTVAGVFVYAAWQL
jgi:Flp pilus assembly protein TadB